VFELVKIYNPIDVLIDDDNASRVFARLMRERGRIRNLCPPVRDVPIRGRSKEIRNAPLRNLALNRRLKAQRGPWLAEFLGELTKFPTARHDDMVDAAGLCATVSASSSAPTPPPEPEPMLGRYFERDGQRFLRASLDDLFEDADHDRPQGVAAMRNDY
jgi:hypothetical protein